MNACMASDTDHPLRTAIDAILDESQAVADQVAALERLRYPHSHTVRQARLGDFIEASAGDTPEYDCFTFALDLIDCPERIELIAEVTQ